LKRHKLALRSLTDGEDEHSMNSDNNDEESSHMGGLPSDVSFCSFLKYIFCFIIPAS
jgi:hypothetical protein